ncbi:MAG: hypothetical protein WBD37_04495, partial [Anderseniella sp.]
AYWRAASAERLVNRFQKLEGRVQRALKNSHRLAGSGQTSPLTALTYERELVDIKKQINTLLLELRSSKMHLAALMNVAPGSNFSLVVPKRMASEQLLIREEMNDLVAAVKYDIAYADLQNAFAAVYASIGVDPFGDDITGQEDAHTLAKSLKRTWS